ncbi:MAG: VacJ family lipoprotein [Alphaproteobacteria bacterium]|nr:VacJ family lipoprotein [Alphaproteobacteria bacterium]
MSIKMKTVSRFILWASMAFALTACGARIDPSPDTAKDPYEGFNRQMFAVNMTLDSYVLKPVAKGYTYVPRPLRRAVRNVIGNLAEPISFANNSLQGEWSRASKSATRFLVNSTIGVFGLFDAASSMGLKRQTEDFGQTLARYGVGEGPYLYLPIIGPSPPRDLAGMVIDWAFDPVTYADNASSNAIGIYMVDGIDFRAENLGVLDEIERSSIDFYASIRSLYRQNRKSEIANGVTSLDDLPELPDMDEFDDFDEDF